MIPGGSPASAVASQLWRDMPVAVAQLEVGIAMSDETQQSAESSERQLCIKCLTPNDPSANFCVKCGAPLGPFAFTNPFESNFAQGSSFREAAERPRNLAVVLGVWLIFGTMAVAGASAVLTIRYIGLPFAIIGVIMSLVSVIIIWKTTRNYLARKQKEAKSDA